MSKRTGGPPIRRRASLSAADPTLFAADRETITAELDQHDTPLWAAQMIVSAKFPHLKAGDVVLEPGCGKGVFLRSLPPGVRGFGVEIDPQRAEIARSLSGHEVVVGNIETVELPRRIDHAIGNPPWDLDLLDILLDRIHPIIVPGGKAGLLLPAYAFQTEGRVMRYNRQWSISCENVPRRLWDGLKHPAVYAEFTADRRHMLVGFLLYAELASIREMPQPYQDELSRPEGGMWFGAVSRALETLGGEATLEGLYREMEGRRPTANVWWKPQVRKICYTKLARTERDTFVLPQAA